VVICATVFFYVRRWRGVLSVSGVRGVYGESLTEAVISQYTDGYVELLAENSVAEGERVAVGRDSRQSGPACLRAVVERLRERGIDVIDLDPYGTAVPFLEMQLSKNTALRENTKKRIGQTLQNIEKAKDTRNAIVKKFDLVFRQKTERNTIVSFLQGVPQKSLWHNTPTFRAMVETVEKNEIEEELPIDKKYSKFVEWFNERFNDQPMTIDPKAVDDYNKWVKEHGTFVEQSAKHVAETKTEIIIEKPKGEEYNVFILEFDWHYGHEKEECKSKKQALARKKEWQEYYVGKWTNFSNWKIYSEIRYRIEIPIS